MHAAVSHTFFILFMHVKIVSATQTSCLIKGHNFYDVFIASQNVIFNQEKVQCCLH